MEQTRFSSFQVREGFISSLSFSSTILIYYVQPLITIYHVVFTQPPLICTREFPHSQIEVTHNVDGTYYYDDWLLTKNPKIFGT